jgi:hypothetical protein
MSAAPKSSPILKLLYGYMWESRPFEGCGKADVVMGRNAQGTMATHRGKGPGMLQRIRGDNVGKGHLPAEADSDLQRHLV